MTKLTFCGPRFILRACSELYGCVVRIRNSLYDKGLLGVYSSGLPVISVGNITAGGNGKTPLVIAIAKELTARGFRPVVISRGYGGTEVGPLKIAELNDSKQVGDEPLLIRRRAGIPVVIARKRADGARFVEKRDLGNVILLDDGFQHRAIDRCCNIVCIRVDDDKAIAEFIRGEMLPLGRFRESRDPALRRADTIVLVNRGLGPVRESPLDGELVKRLPTHARIFRSDVKIDGVHHLVDGQSLQPGPVIATSGIANPNVFYESLETLGFTLIDKFTFKDHYRYTSSDLEDLRAKHPGVPIVCTEKDAIKIMELRNTSGVYELRMNAAIRPADAFIVHLERAMETFRSEKGSEG